MNELFETRNTQGATHFVYPESPGFKKEGTSELAATSMRSRSNNLQEAVQSGKLANVYELIP